MKAAHRLVVLLAHPIAYPSESAPGILLPDASFTGARDKLLGFQNQMPAHPKRASAGTKVRTSTS